MGRLICIAAALLVLGIPLARAEDPDALWKIVHDRCVPDQLQHATPDPCMLVDLGAGVDHGFVLLKDRDGTTQILLMPTAKITGIESPDILAPDATNYFAYAWLAVPRLNALAHRDLPRDDVSLAINSISGRSQNQLHIHIDCISAAVRDALHQHAAEIGEHWAPLDVKLAGHQYLAMRVAGEQLDGNPFRLLADGVPGAAADMAHQTLVVTGTVLPDGRRGFILLADHADPAAGDHGSGEELQDHACHGP
jgi:CDP-diacylglycerol pyrophosphatase